MQPAVPCLRFLLLAQIAADLGKPAQVSRWVAQRDEGGAGQKLSTVSPHARAGFVVPAACGGYSEHLFRPALLDIFRKKKAGVIVADNLIRGVSHDSLRAGAPTGNLAMRVQH